MCSSPSNKRKGVFVLTAVLFFTSIYVVRIREDMADFRVNYQAGARLRAGEDLYQTEDGHFMFKYLPFSALLYLPLSLLPLEVAKAVWYATLVCGAIALFQLSKRVVVSEAASRAAMLVFPPLILAKFFLREMKLGQINIIVTLILLGMVWFLTSTPLGQPRSKPLAGLLWGLATAVKPYGAIFIPYFLLKKQWTALAAGIGVITLALLLPSFFYGLRGNLLLLYDWIFTLSRSTPGLLLSNDNVSIAAFFMKWSQNRELSLLLAGVTIAALAIAVLVLIRRGDRLQRAVTLECSLLLTLIPLVSPLGWDYTFLMSILAVTVLVANYSHYSLAARILLIVNFCIIALSIYDLVGPRFYGTFMAWSVLTINFLVVVVLLAMLRIKKIA